MKNIELNHLKYFYHTVLEGGVGPAAQRLNVQQPVVSKMLKHLNDEFDQELFWKQGRKKCLTDYGQMVFRHCQTIFEEVNRIKQVSNSSEEVTGSLSIGAAESITNYLLTPCFNKLITKYPQLNFNSHTSSQNHLMTMLSQGNIDIGCFFYAPNLSSDLEIVKKVNFPFRLVIKKSCLKDKKVIETFIGSREIDDTSTHNFPTLDFVRKKYPKTEIKLSSNSITLHKQLVLAGKGISVMPEYIIEKELARKTLVDLLPRKKFSWPLLFIKRKSSYLSAPAEAFLNHWS